MSFKDDVRERLINYLGIWGTQCEPRTPTEVVADGILNSPLFPEIAIVDRSAKPPTLGDFPYTADYVDGHIRARNNIVEQGWVKEVK